jgi:hypothetical protein
MPATPARGHILLNGRPYRVDLESYRQSDVVDFSPRRATPGGSILHSELGLYQPLLQTDWRHGFGFSWFDDAMGYLRTDGRVDTRHSGVAMLYTNSTSSDTNNNRKEGFTAFNGDWWGFGAGGLRRYNSGAWSDSGGYGAVQAVLATGSYLFVSRTGANRLRRVTTGLVHQDAGLDANANDYSWLVIHNGLVYAGKANTNRVHFSNQEDLSDLEGTTSDPDAIYVGFGNFTTVGAISFNGKLYVFRHDGMWTIDEQRIARKVLDFSDQVSGNNFRSWAVHNGQLVFPIRDRIFQWNGVRLADITPPRVSDVFPYITYGNFDNFVSVGRFLYCTARDNQFSYAEDLLCYDGVGWFKLANLMSGTTGSISAMAYDAVNNYLWYHHDTTADATYYIQQQNLSEFPYSNFPTTGTHSLLTSRLDMGFRRVIKSVTSLIVETSAVSANVNIPVYYSLDGGPWVLWSTVAVSGVTELTNPGGNPSVEFRFIRLRFDFVTNSFQQTPVLEGFTLRFIMRPDVRYGWSFNIPAASHMEHAGMEDERTAYDIVTNLRADRDSKAPLTYTDIWGDVWRVYISAFTIRAVEMHSDGEGEDNAPDIEHVVQVNLVEAA